MAVTDIEWVSRVEKELFPHPWKPIAFFQELEQKHAFCYMVLTNEPQRKSEPVGYCCFHLVLDEMHLLKIAVKSHYQKRGAGKCMLKRCFEVAVGRGASIVFLEVRPSNEAALEFYRKIGFKLIGKRPNYYAEDGEDALVLKNNLKEALI